MTRNPALPQPVGLAPSTAGIVPPARWLFRRLVNIGKWFVGITALLFATLPPLVNALGGSLDFSIWEQFANNGPNWFLLGMGATLVANYLPVIVAQGVTRGRFAIAAALVLAAGALVLGVFLWLGLGLEALYFRGFGWPHNLLGDHLFASTSQAPLVILQYGVRALLFGLTGLLVGYGYYRFGGVWGTALLPFTAVLPLALGTALISLTGFNAALTLTWMTKTTAFGIGMTLLYCALLVLIARLLIATLAIRTKAG